MDDNLEQLVLQQTVQVYLKYFSKIFIGVPNFGYYLFGNIMRILRPEVILCIFLVFVLFLYLQVIQLWTADLAGRFSPKLFKKSVKVTSSSLSGFKGPYWQEQREISSVFAIQGRRPKMEDR
jgi:protein phosphatase 1L